MIFWLNTEERISQEELETTNSGPLSAKVVNNRFDQVYVLQEAVGHGDLELQITLPQFLFRDVQYEPVMMSSIH